jgi:hypothetical protein
MRSRRNNHINGALRRRSINQMKTLTAIYIALILGTAWANRPFECDTDTECEAAEAARCWIFCES